VLDPLIQNLCDAARLPWSVGGRVDHGIKTSSAEGRQVAVTVATQFLNLRKEIRIVSPSVEKRDPMPSSQR
jgi:hypothetical protein